MRLTRSLLLGLIVSVILLGCAAGGEDQGTEYAPNMYHSVPYEPLKQITDKDAGRWVTSIDYPDGHAEYYNSNNLNPYQINLRVPPANTVRRNAWGWTPYRIGKDSLAYAARTLVNPLDTTQAILTQGKVLYEVYCDHCHDAKGTGEGPVSTKYGGVANLKNDALKNISEGHIFHVITYGKGLMWPHGSQIAPEDRWKIARYVKTLQK